MIAPIGRTQYARGIPIGGFDDDEDFAGIPPVAPPPATKPESAPIGTSVSAAPDPAATKPVPIGNPRLEADQNRLGYLQRAGSGVDQITRPVDQEGNPTGQHVGLGKKILGGIARVGDVAVGTMFPAAAELIPGTTLHHEALIGNQARAVGNDLAVDTREAQANEQNARADALRNPPVKPAPQPNPAQIAKLAQLGYRLGDNGELVQLSDEELSPELSAQREFQQAAKELKQAQTSLANSKNDPNSAAYKLEQAKVDAARERTQQAMQAIGLHEQQFQNKLHEQDFVKPSGQSQSRGSAAQSVLDTLPHVVDLIRKNGKEFGPIIGRINKGEIAIGSVSPQVAELYTALKSLYALQPAVHGFRNAEFVTDFEHAIGNLERNPEAVAAGIEGLKPTLQAVAREGKTFHRRIVEGEGGGQQSGTPKVGDVKKFPNGKTGTWDGHGWVAQ